jgi:predicted ATP-dependent serine protease
MSNEKNALYIVGGGKGGVGKSTVTHALLDYLLKQDIDILYVETDSSNPDIFKMLEGNDQGIETTICDLDTLEGYERLIDIVEQHSDRAIVVNTAARVTTTMCEYMPLITESLTILKRSLKILWPLDDGKDCVILLKNFIDVVNSDHVFTVLKNGYFAKDESFSIFNGSKLSQRVRSFYFPAFEGASARFFKNNRLAVWEIENNDTKATLGVKVFTKRYRDNTNKIFSEAFA